MARFWAAQGIGHVSKPNPNGNNPGPMAEFPFAVIQGPSGQLVQLLPPSGFAGKIPSNGEQRTWHSSEMTLSHSNVAWKRNKLIFAWTKGTSTNSMRCFAWNPQPQEAAKVNPAGNVELWTSVKLEDRVIADGSNWEMWNPDWRVKNFFVGYSIHDGVVYFRKVSSLLDEIYTGIYKGNEPEKHDATNWQYAGGFYGTHTNSNDGGFSRLPANGDSTPANQAGISMQDGVAVYPTDIDKNICEVVKHNDTFYIIGQYFIMASTPGCKGNFIHQDVGVDTGVAFGDVDGYTSRATQGQIGSYMRSATVHNDKVWMLQNNGKIYQIRPGGITLSADLTNLGTPWASGILGAYLQQIGASDWAGSKGAYRPLLRSFNGQLHAFLNFRTTNGVANGKGTQGNTGHGICWFTSHDGVNWQDRSTMLPGSGIQPAEGLDSGTWITNISPYIFSGLDNVSYPSGYGLSAPQAGGIPIKPSGFVQPGILPFWASGALLDTPGTPYNALSTPLQRGALSGYIFPTTVAYPASFDYQNSISGGLLPQESGGVWLPYGVGSSGYDYTGVTNYHIGGVVDNDDPSDPRLRLYFSRDFNGTLAGAAPQVPTLFFDLTKESGFIQKNEAWKCGQLNGYTPIELHDPEIIIPSGTIYNPNPRVDTVNKRVKVDFIATDWLYWDKINVRMEYSLNGGTSWATATTSGSKNSLSTATKQTDPSGMGISAAQKHTLYWLYDQDISKNEFFPRTILRIRGEVT